MATETFVVVMVRNAAEDDPNEWHGRAEHVRTGTRVTFATAEELLAFFRRFEAAEREDGG